MSRASSRTAAAPAARAPADPTARAARQALRRRVSLVALVLAVGLGVVVTRAIWAGSRALANGDAAHQQGELALAVELWRSAARWYVPGAPHVGAAYERLETLAHAAEERGDLDTALAAWRGVRSSILATRSLYVPHEERLDPANRRIAALMAAHERALGVGPPDTLNSEDAAADAPGAAPADAPGDARSGPADALAGDPAARWHYERLAPIPGSSPFWSVIAILGFATWLGGGLLFALRGITPDDRLVPRTAAYAGVLVACGLVVWLLGLYLA